MKESLFNKIEQKTNINKETIINLAHKLQQGDIKNDENIREIIQDLSKLTGKEVSKEKEEKIIKAIQEDRIPKNMDQMF